MARVNPVTERLERENRMLRDQIERMRQEPPDVPFVGCDHSCVVAPVRGMGTNGGCRCDEVKLRRAVQWWKRRAEFLQITVQDMRESFETKGHLFRGAPDFRCTYCGVKFGEAGGVPCSPHDPTRDKSGT